MDKQQLNDNLINFWDQHFKTLKAEIVSKDSYTESSTLLDKVKYLADHCQSILDFGCGSGYALFYAALFGEKIKEGYGIDTSEFAISFAKETKELSNLESLFFIKGNHKDINNLDVKQFDGVICSNVLDVVPYDTSEEMINSLDRVIKPGGLLLLKLNFLLTKELIEKIKMIEIDDNTYEINGVLRAVNLNTKTWLERFKNFDLIEEVGFQRIKNGPKDRVLIMKKKKQI